MPAGQAAQGLFASINPFEEYVPCAHSSAQSLDDVDPKLLDTYKKLGIPLKEQMILAGVEGAEDAPAEGRKVAVDAVFDSVSVGTTFQRN